MTAEPLTMAVSDTSLPQTIRQSPLLPDHTPCAPPPKLDPLRNETVQDEIRGMRQRMRKYFQLKVHQKSVKLLINGMALNGMALNYLHTLP